MYWGTSEWLASEIEEAWAVADRLGLIGPSKSIRPVPPKSGSNKK
jgi:hypothetical protein